METPAVHVWLLSSPDTLHGDALDFLYGYISPPEKKRHDGMGSAERRREFLLGHALSRLMAGHLLGESPSSVPLVFEERKKPELQRPPYWLSLTHTNQIIAAAMAPYPVGIDIEKIGSVRNRFEVAEIHFAPEEAVELGNLPLFQQSVYFTQLWALREAFYKAAPLTWREIRTLARFRKTAEGEITFVPKGLPESDLWEFAWAPLPDDHLLALAAQPKYPLAHGAQVFANEREIQYGDASQERGVLTQLDFPPVAMNTLSPENLVEVTKGEAIDLRPFSKPEIKDPVEEDEDALQEGEGLMGNDFSEGGVSFPKPHSLRGSLASTTRMGRLAGQTRTGIALRVIRGR